jgi:hypothetical protein
MSKRGWNKNEPLDDEFDFEVPEKPLDFVSRQITDINSFAKFYDIVRLPIDELECLCSLPDGYFSPYYNETVLEEDLRTHQIGYKQLTLFPDGDIPHA